MKLMFSLKTLIAIIALTCSTTLASAQPGDPGNDPDPNQPNTSVPFDGGLTLLVIAGAGFAIKKSREKRQNDKFTS